MVTDTVMSGAAHGGGGGGDGGRVVSSGDAQFALGGVGRNG